MKTKNKKVVMSGPFWENTTSEAPIPLWFVTIHDLNESNPNTDNADKIYRVNWYGHAVALARKIAKDQGLPLFEPGVPCWEHPLWLRRSAA